jgi:DNA-binding CsgD family transcriptional regulator
MRQLRRTTFYNEISRKLCVNWQLTIYLPLPAAHTLFVAALRQRTDFSRRERTLLELLRPHIGTAWLRAVRLDEQRAQMAPPLASIRPALHEQSASCSRILQHRLGLTAREAEVLFWVSEGKTNASIGAILGRSPETVKSHVGSLLAKLGCETRTAAARTALESIGGDLKHESFRKSLHRDAMLADGLWGGAKGDDAKAEEFYREKPDDSSRTRENSSRTFSLRVPARARTARAARETPNRPCHPGEPARK